MAPQEPHEVPAPTGCTRPELGRLLDAYLQGGLSETEQADFEAHYFGCEACFRAIQLHQDLEEHLEQQAAGGALPVRSRAGLRRVPWWGWTAAGAVAAGLGAIVLFGLPDRSSGERPPVVLRLEGTFRGHAGAATVPAGRDIVLVLAVPVPARAAASYDVEVARADGTIAFAAPDIAASGPSEVQVAIPRGALAPGRHEVTLREKGPEEPLVLRFAFEVGTLAGE